MIDALELKKKELALAREKLRLKEELPHLYGFPWYTWAWDFFTTKNREAYLCAGNQLSKSSTQIRKAIHWATATDLWPELWPNSIATPNSIWYLYPNRDVATEEFELKWQEFLPRGAMKDDPKYGWKAEYRNKKIYAIYFNSGMSLYFKCYSQDVSDLQTGSVYAIFCFPEGTEIYTKEGKKDISKIEVGEEVLSHKGFRKVIASGNRQARIREIKFKYSNIKVTDEHPFFTSRGWIEAKDLQEGDVCFKTPAWAKELLQTWYYLKGYFTEDIQKTKILERETIGLEKIASTFTYQYGRRSIKEKLEKVTSYTTQILTRLTMQLAISYAYPGVSTQKYTKSKNGRKEKNFHLSVFHAGLSLLQDLLKRMSQDIVQKLVGVALIGIRVAVQSVIARFLLGKIASRDFVQSNVPIQEDTKVYSITVDDAHTYFANDFLTHNCDEELPISHLPELRARLNATDGYFSMVFTATLGQDYWRLVIEGQGDEELQPHAWKKQVSLYECQFYKDGTPSPWTKEKIERAIQRCSTQAEILRRIYGKFVYIGGRKIEAFSRERNICPPHKVASDWLIYTGVDYGSGGESNHPAAMVFTAVSPDYKMGRVFRARRMDGILTTAQDVFDEYIKIRGGLKPVLQTYDWASKDFHTFAARRGEAFQKANKDQETGVQTLNTLFKSGMLKIFDNDPELEKLVSEILTLRSDQKKTSSAVKDDLLDALRYSVMSVPWDWSVLDEISFDEEGRIKEPQKPKVKNEIDLRREFVFGSDKPVDEFEEDFNEWVGLINEFDS